MTGNEKRDQIAEDQEQDDGGPTRRVMPDEIVPLDSGKREGEDYLLEEETAVDMMAVSAGADAITDRINSRGRTRRAAMVCRRGFREAPASGPIRPQAPAR